MSEVTVAFEAPTNADLAAMHEARIAFSFEGYDPEDCFTPPISALANPDMRFRIARVGGALAGMAALRIDDGWGEVKAVFTDPAMRGKGVARALMKELEQVGRAFAS